MCWDEADFYANYAENHHQDIVWGKGKFNWRRNWEQTEPMFKFDPEEDLEVPF